MSVLLSILGVIDVGLVIAAAETSGAGGSFWNKLGLGALEALNDPAKTIFHVFLLPLAMFVYLRGVPGSRLIRGAVTEASIIALVLLAVGFALAQSAHSQFTSSAPDQRLLRSAADCPDPAQRRKLFNLRKEEREIKNWADQLNELEKRYKQFAEIEDKDECKKYII
ncbi:MAG: hypothetical protein P0121_02520 [Nitrospira sp.]|nr:hypothetical protein [Nitrospira sp.]